jgi:hypothetical protein
MTAFPKPKDQKKVRKYLDDDGVYRYPDGREVCDLNSKKGRDEYIRRKRVAWENQKRICPLCMKSLNWSDSTVDHKEPRGMGGARRDDRQEKIQAVHAVCNCEKGSRRINCLIDIP